MKIRLGELRRIIREVLVEAGGGTTVPPQPVKTNPGISSMPNREQIGRISVKDLDNPEELSPHLREPVHDEEDCWGPVPPTAPNPHAMPDFD